MVALPDEYAWSSFRSDGLGKEVKLWTPHRVYSRLGNTPEERACAYRHLFTHHLESGTVSQMRQATNAGMALGNDRFKEEVERLSGRRVTPLSRGPKKRTV